MRIYQQTIHLPKTWHSVYRSNFFLFIYRSICHFLYFYISIYVYLYILLSFVFIYLYIYISIYLQLHISIFILSITIILCISAEQTVTPSAKFLLASFSISQAITRLKTNKKEDFHLIIVRGYSTPCFTEEMRCYKFSLQDLCKMLAWRR